MVRIIVILALILSYQGFPTFAQADSSISGLVLDVHGAALPLAKIHLRLRDSVGVNSVETKTDDSGKFLFEHLMKTRRKGSDLQ